MAEPFVLATAASNDLTDVWYFTVEKWGRAQADRFLDQLFLAMDAICEGPEMHRERHEVDPPVRIHRMSSHLIVYRIEDGKVLILRVVHGRRNWSGLFGGPDD